MKSKLEIKKYFIACGDIENVRIIRDENFKGSYLMLFNINKEKDLHMLNLQLKRDIKME